LVEVGLLVLLLTIIVYRWITKSFDKWKNAGIPHDKPSFPQGTHNILGQKKHLTEHCHEDYIKFKIEKKQKVHGWFLFGKPALSINDVEMLKHLEVKDFNHFMDRNESNASKLFGSGGDLDKLWGLQMSNLSGDHWKDIRSTFTPIFTSGKMKGMVKLIHEITEGLVMEIGQKAKLGEEFNLKDTFGKFSLDALATSAFGVDAQSFTNSKSVFVKYASTIFVNTFMENLLNFSKFIPGVSWIYEMFNISIFKPTQTKYLRDVILNVLKVRKESGERRNDLIDLMLDCIENEQKVDINFNEDDQSQYDIDMKLVHDRKSKKNNRDRNCSKAIIFLVAGYDTTGMTLSFLAYAMSKNPDIQERLQEEVDQAFEDNDGTMPDYQTIQNLPFLDMVIHETLRYFNPIGLMTRTCTEDYTLPGTDIVVKKNDLLTFSTLGIHRDPEHYSHPDIFYPEHFSKEEKSARHPYAFQAFGQGPRACIGMRFALLEAKIAVLEVWRRFSFMGGNKTLEPLVLDPTSQLGWVKGGLWSGVKERDS